MLKRNLFVIILIAVFIVISVFLSLFYFRYPISGENIYDVLHENKTVTQYSQAKQILSGYSKSSYSELPAEVKRQMPKNIDDDFYVIPENELYKKFASIIGLIPFCPVKKGL